MSNATTMHKIGKVDYPVAWGNLAMFRFRSIPEAQRGVVGPAQLAQFVWAAYKGVVHPFPTWEHTFAAMADMDDSALAALSEDVVSKLPEPDEKAAPAPATVAESEPTDAEKKRTSTSPAPLPVVASD